MESSFPPPPPPPYRYTCKLLCRVNYSTGFCQIKVHLIKGLLLYSGGLGLVLHSAVPAGRLIQEQRGSCSLPFACPPSTCWRAGSSEGSKGFLSGPAAPWNIPSRCLGWQLLCSQTERRGDILNGLLRGHLGEIENSCSRFVTGCVTGKKRESA